jgi:hypothetical protein
MCAPHQATLMDDCTALEAAGLLAIAGYNSNREFLDLYVSKSAQNEVCEILVRVARDREVLRTTLIALPDNPQGGREALDIFRRWEQGDSLCASSPKGEHGSNARRCCH